MWTVQVTSNLRHGKPCNLKSLQLKLYLLAILGGGVGGVRDPDTTVLFESKIKLNALQTWNFWGRRKCSPKINSQDKFSVTGTESEGPGMPTGMGVKVRAGGPTPPQRTPWEICLGHDNSRGSRAHPWGDSFPGASTALMTCDPNDKYTSC